MPEISATTDPPLSARRKVAVQRMAGRHGMILLVGLALACEGFMLGIAVTLPFSLLAAVLWVGAPITLVGLVFLLHSQIGHFAVSVMSAFQLELDGTGTSPIGPPRSPQARQSPSRGYVN